MKSKKVNHSEILNRLNAEYMSLTSERDSLRQQWIESMDEQGNRDNELWDRYHSKRYAVEKLEKEMNFHRIMLQDKKYATEWLWSDAHAYEIIEERTDKMIFVRRMKATIKPEASKALKESFVPGGFVGHFNNDLQEWDFEQDESNPIETIRKHKNGLWYGHGKRHFTIEAEPYERYDYNF